MSSRLTAQRSNRVSLVPQRATDGFEGSLEKIKKNIMEGEVGKRGEVYVASQLFLLLCILVGTVPLISSSLYFLAGPLSMAVGGGMIVASVYQLQGDLSPWIVKPAGSTLRTDGIYEYVRHPIYGGLVLLCLGIAVVTNSANRLILTAALYFVLDQKATVEEENLKENDPSYGAYAEKTSGKLLPDVRELLSSE